MTTFRNVLAAVSASLPCCSVAATGEAILTAKLLKPMLGDCSIKRRLTNTEWQVMLLTSGKVVWDVCPQVLCISAVSNFVLHFTGGYYKTTLNRWTEILRHAPRARLCLHSAIQSVVCRQDLTSKLLVAPLYVTVCPIICFKPSLRTYVESL